MIIKRVGNDCEIHRLMIHDGRVGVGTMSKGVPLKLDIEYWSLRFPSRRDEHLERIFDCDGNPKPNADPILVKYFKEYWAHQDFYSHLLKVGTTIGISEEHIQNLAAPLMEVEFATSLRHMRNAKPTSMQFDDLVELVESLEDNYTEIKNIRVETGYLTGWDVLTAGQKIKVTNKYKFDTYAIIKVIRNLLESWRQEGKTYNDLVKNSELRGYSDYSISNEERKNEKQMILVVYDYIVNHDLHERKEPIINKKDSGFNNACRLTGFMFEAAKLSRLIERLKHIQSVEKKRHDLSTMPDIKSGQRKNPINVIPDIRQLNLEKELEPHGLKGYIESLGDYGVRDNLSDVIDKVETIISNMGSLSYNPGDKLVDRYRKTIKTLLTHLEN